MSKVITNNITPRSGSSVGLTGDLTASGNITGVGGTFSGPVSGTTGTFSGAVSGTTGTFSGNVSVGGTLTYEDVTNIDSVGIITARSDVSIADKIVHTGDTNTAIRFPAADTFTVETGGVERARVNSGGVLLGLTAAVGEGGTPADLNSTEVGRGFINLSRDDTAAADHILFGKNGSIAASMGTDTTNTLVFKTGTTERVRITSAGAAIFKAGLAEKYNKGTTLAAASNNVALGSGNVHRFTSNESGAKTVNFTGVHATLSDGESVSFTVLVTPANAGYINAATVDGVAPGGGLKWSGGSAPSAGGASGRDVYTFTIFKDGTATNSYEIFGAATNYA